MKKIEKEVKRIEEEMKKIEEVSPLMLLLINRGGENDASSVG